MKEKINKLKSFINCKNLEFFSYILLLFWAISPIVEYIFSRFDNLYTHYYTSSIYIIGSLGIIEYFIYKYKNKTKNPFNIKKYIPQILILSLLIISIISTFLSDNPYLSFFGENYRKEGLLVYIMYIGFVLMSSTIKNEKYMNNIFNIIIFSALYISIVPLFSDDFTYHNFTNIFNNINHYGYFLMIGCNISAYMFVRCDGVKKILYLIGYIILIYMLIRNNTFGCFLSISIVLAFSFIYSLIKKSKRIDMIILVITFIITSFIISFFDIKIGERIYRGYKQDLLSENIIVLKKDVNNFFESKNKDIFNKTGSGRGKLWKEASTYIMKRPIFGGGMECLKKYYHDKKIYIDRPHNMILQVAAFIGIPGAVIYIILLLYLALGNLKYLKIGSIDFVIYTTAMCYFISSLFGNSMYYTSPYFMILLGFLINMKLSKNKS